MATDYVFIRKSRNTISSVLHVLMNILLGVGTIFVGIVSGSWLIGIILVLVSKWRTFAVRPRYLFLNIKASLVDLIVGCSFVFLGYFSGSSVVLPVHYLLAAGYTLWLIAIKPQTSPFWTSVQAIVAVFLGTSVATIASASTNSVVLVLAEFLIGYAAARHVLAQNNNSLHDGFPAFIFALMFAEIALFAHSWLIIYPFQIYGIMIPQLSIILSIFAFVAVKLYENVESRDGDLKVREVAIPIVFAVILLAVIVAGFSEPTFDI
ncbi:hypothetical protein IJG20_01170 [Candidatus Saccharibacteria bacterium]|nr:hypothetical protein [Candidatus Saccharibacteria bacterium]